MSSLAPSATRVVPFIKLASSDARKQMAAASSSGLPIAPVGFSIPLFTLGLFQSIGVSTDPGATQLKRTFVEGYSWLAPRTKASIAPLLLAYGITLAVVSCACTELIFTTAPRFI